MTIFCAGSHLYGRGYTYLLFAFLGVTGAENRILLPLHHLVKLKSTITAPAVTQGFGISSPEQVSAYVRAGAAGAISGSAIVKIIEKNLASLPEQMLAGSGPLILQR